MCIYLNKENKIKGYILFTLNPMKLGELCLLVKVDF